MNLFEDIYDGELNFEIENYIIESEYISMDLLSEYQEKTVGLQVTNVTDLEAIVERQPASGH